jgi:hypothetical protein
MSGRKGVVRIDTDRHADLYLSGPSIVGLAFTPSKAMVVATNNAVFRVDVGIHGLLPG